MLHHLGIVSGLLTALCVVPYLRDIRRGTTRPQRTSWLVFATLSIVAAVSQLLNGDMAGAWLSAGSACGFTAVFVVSIWRGEGGWSRADRFSLAVALVGVTASIVVRQPIVAVVSVIVAELAAVAMTARKASRDPDSETMTTWVVDGVAGVVAISAVTRPSIAALLYPVHHVCANGWVVAAIVRGRRARTARQLPRHLPKADGVGAPEGVGIDEGTGDRRVVAGQ